MSDKMDKHKKDCKDCGSGCSCNKDKKEGDDEQDEVE